MKRKADFLKKLRKWTVLVFVLVLFGEIALPATASADGEPYALTLLIEGEQKPVRAYDSSYRYNTYLSLADLAAVLEGTGKQFRFERVISSTDGEYFTVSRGQLPALASGAAGHAERTRPVFLNTIRNRLIVDGEERKYYTFNPQNGDLYMNMVDIQLMLDMPIEKENGMWALRTDRPFQTDLESLRQSGFFDGLNSVLLADADSGEVLFQLKPDEVLPIASLTKLLSYVVLKDAIAMGEIGADDMVTISKNVEDLSLSPDGIIKMHAGAMVPLRELMEGMLIASSNESAVALAEHLCGSEEAFIGRMVSRAQTLGLYSAELHNSNGLPSYTDGNIPVKRQNQMSASDLFKLTQLILRQYPEITEITSQQLGHMPTLDDYWTANSNPLLFNMKGVTGLKTGSTNRAGYCLVATLPVQRGTETHQVVLVLLGAESAEFRGQAAELLLRYAQNALK